MAIASCLCQGSTLFFLLPKIAIFVSLEGKFRSCHFLLLNLVVLCFGLKKKKKSIKETKNQHKEREKFVQQKHLKQFLCLQNYLTRLDPELTLMSLFTLLFITNTIYLRRTTWQIQLTVTIRFFLQLYCLQYMWFYSVMVSTSAFQAESWDSQTNHISTLRLQGAAQLLSSCYQGVFFLPTFA